MTTITAKIQIFVPDNQVEHLKVTMDIYRKACNWLSNHVFETKNLNQVKLNHLYYSDLRQHFGLKSQMAQSVMKTVIARCMRICTIPKCVPAKRLAKGRSLP